MKRLSFVAMLLLAAVAVARPPQPAAITTAVATPISADFYTLSSNTIYHVDLHSGRSKVVASYPLSGGAVPENDYFSCATVSSAGGLLLGGNTQRQNIDDGPIPGIFKANQDWSISRLGPFVTSPWAQISYRGTELFTFEQYSGISGNLPVVVDMYPVGETFAELFAATWFMTSDGSLLYLFAWNGTWHNYSVQIGNPVNGYYPGHVVELSQTVEDGLHFGPACFHAGKMYRYAYNGQGNAWLTTIDLPTGKATIASAPFSAPGHAIFFIPRKGL